MVAIREAHDGTPPEGVEKDAFNFAPIDKTAPLEPEGGTTDAVETKPEIMVKSLLEALAFLADPTKVGPSQSGGFGTDDVTAWRWGALHTVTLVNNVSPTYDIPPASEQPDGFPRHCDNFCVDASHPGLSDTRFTFSSGPAIRNVYDMTEPVVFHGVIPGGQSEDPRNPHYADEMALWVNNAAPQIPFTDADVIAAKESNIDFVAPSDRTALP